MRKKVRIGVLGAGYLGKIHLSLLQNLSGFELVGFYDSDVQMSREVVSEFGITAFPNASELINSIDAVDIVTPTTEHFKCAVDAIRATKHVFIEKPITYTPDEAESLIKFSHEAGVVVQVGHVERFNPAFQAGRKYFHNPMFIESHRLSPYNPRGTDVPVVLDLMIHDIDIVLSIVRSNIKSISASGVAVVSETPDIANARIEFDNGAVANLTASRISMGKMRKSRFFQRDAYIVVDFLNRETEVFRLPDNTLRNSLPAYSIDFGDKRGRTEILVEKPDIPSVNAIAEELKSFALSIENKSTPLVTIEDGFNAVQVAHMILGKMKNVYNDYKLNI
jgi:predicted dehydrogenase